MTSRIVAIGILVTILGVVGAFMAIALIGPRDASTDSAPIMLTKSIGEWRVHARLTLGASDGYALDLRFADEGGESASMSSRPTVRVSMLDHDMGITSLAVETVGVGSYRAFGSLDMAGRWRFRIELTGNHADMIVDFRRKGSP